MVPMSPSHTSDVNGLDRRSCKKVGNCVNIDPMDDAPSPPGSSWSPVPGAKRKNAVQRSVTALLDELAPERVLGKAAKLPARIEQHRTSSGCVLQAAGSALSVSWFEESSPDAELGELHVVVWRGTLTRRGTPRGQNRAETVGELILRPIEAATDQCLWQATDGSRYDTASLAAKCLALLEAQIGDPAD